MFAQAIKTVISNVPLYGLRRVLIYVVSVQAHVHVLLQLSGRWAMIVHSLGHSMAFTLNEGTCGPSAYVRAWLLCQSVAADTPCGSHSADAARSNFLWC